MIWQFFIYIYFGKMRIEIPKTSYTIGSLNKGLKLLKKPNGALFEQILLIASVWDNKNQFVWVELQVGY